ncbi:MAG: class I SAM-dependent methyltransferase [Halobacteriales archaeon]
MTEPEGRLEGGQIPDAGRTLDVDPYGRAIRDYHRGEQEAPLSDVDGVERRDHPIEEFYFEEFHPEADGNEWLAGHLDGPLLDLGAGTGRHALCFQEQFETVAVDVSDHLVAVMDDRGVEDARQVDMFRLRGRFGRDRFRSVLSIGTQTNLAGSMQGLRRFLGELAFVTTADATAVVDSYDPGQERTAESFGFRQDPTPGLAYRAYHYEYEGDVGATLLFRLFSPDRLREAAVGTGWTVEDVRHHPREDPMQYRALLRKRSG